MSMTPSDLTSASFRTVRKGYDPDEVNSLLAQAATALEQAQQRATAMEARARASVARLREQTEQAAQRPEPTSEATGGDAATGETADGDSVRLGPDEAETISRTLVLAQRTADTTVSEAEADADRIRAEARAEAAETLDSTRAMSAQLLDEARAEARKVGETERVAVADEVESLRARREFLLGDVDQLESFLVDQRERLRGAAHQIEALCERIPSGLGRVSAPAVSASDDEPGEDTAELFVPPGAVAEAQQLADPDGDASAGGDDVGGPDTGELDATQLIEQLGAVADDADGGTDGDPSDQQNPASI